MPISNVLPEVPSFRVSKVLVKGPHLYQNIYSQQDVFLKWKQIYSSERKLNGGGPQGALLGILEYLAQSNDNAYMVKPEDRFKLVDDLTTLEIINRPGVAGAVL